MIARLASLVVAAGCMRPAPACPCAPGARSIATAIPPPPIERTVWITPEIRADTRVLADAIQSAQITFATGTQVMLVIALSQGANTAIADRGAAVGTARIDPGLRLDLQIATPLQSGAVYLDGTFASSNLPSVHFQGALATWSAPPAVPLPAAKE